MLPWNSLGNNAIMFCLITSSKLSCQHFEFSLRWWDPSNPGNLFYFTVIEQKEKQISWALQGSDWPAMIDEDWKVLQWKLNLSFLGFKDWAVKKVTIPNSTSLMVKSSEIILFFYLHFTWLYIWLSEGNKLEITWYENTWSF